jgi:hypothetical protein
MKSYGIALLMFLISSPFFAQSVFDQFDGMAGVNAVVMNKKMFDLMSKVKIDTSDKETQQYMSLIKKIDNLKVFSTSNARTALQMKLTADKHAKTAGLEELASQNGNGKNIRILVKPGASVTQVKELLLFIQGTAGEDTVLMSLTGDIDLNEVPALTSKMKIPGNSEIRKVLEN